MKSEMEQQLERLENNLRTFNPYALEHLLPGLTRDEIDLREKSLNIELEPDLRALYSWRNGSYTYFSPKRRYHQRAAEFFPGNIFFSLDEALQEGDKIDPYLYKRPRIVDASFLENLICVFASIAWSFDANYGQLYLPFSTRSEISYDLPLFYEGGQDSYTIEFQFDSLIHLFDHINYIYENDCLEIGKPSNSFSGDDIRGDRSIKNWNGKRMISHIYESNTYCAEINQAVFGSPWPSRFFSEGR